VGQKRRRGMAAAAASVVATMVAVAGCGSSGGSTASGSGAPTKTITIGVLTDATGPAASASASSVDGVKAGVAYAARNGYTIKYVVGDTATNPATALAAAQKLVTQDHVTAVIGHSALLFAATNYLTAHNVPVVGIPEDGPEWTTSKNMFQVTGPLDQTYVYSTSGDFLKAKGVTSFGAIGYSVSPQSSEAASAAAESVKRAGIAVGYLNAKFPFGSTDVGPTVIAMKNAHIDGYTGQVDPNTNFAILSALRDQNVQLKAALMPTGYGGDIEQAGPGALQAADGSYFALTYEPVEMGTPATKQFQADLKTAGIGEPTYAMYNGYTSVGLIVQALKATPDVTQANLLTSLSKIKSWDALGLVGDHPVDPTAREPNPTQCIWVTQLTGTTFKTVPNAIPACGPIIPGVRVAPAS